MDPSTVGVGLLSRMASGADSMAAEDQSSKGPAGLAKRSVKRPASAVALYVGSPVSSKTSLTTSSRNWLLRMRTIPPLAIPS